VSRPGDQRSVGLDKERIRLRTNVMLSWVIGFLIIALVAALFGFTGLAGAAANIAQVLFYIFILLFVVSLIVSLVSGRRT
jgi:uncharacterized membrane protein YtjA (UPF0391 family)